MRSLAPYGPDRQRLALDGEAALVCALSAFTPEDVGQSQPVSGGDGRYAMVFDGRIDNREDIIRDLGLRPSDAVMMSDTAERTMLLARDPFGSRSLVYHSTPRWTVVATMPCGLHALPDIPRALDEQKLADALCRVGTDNTRTFYEGIAICPAGSFMLVDRGGIQTQRYYQFSERIQPVRYRKDEDYVEAARELFRDAVRAQLRSPGPVGILMSGGLDSSTCAIFASDLLERRGERLSAFAWAPEAGWDGRVEGHVYGDETPYVRAIADRYPNIDLNILEAAGRSYDYNQDVFLRLSDMTVPHAALAHLFQTAFEEAKQRKIRVMLTGSSGNMTLSYQGEGLYADLWVSGQVLRLLRELKALKPGLVGMAGNFYRYVLPVALTHDQWDWLKRIRGQSADADIWRRYSTADPAFAERMEMADRARGTSHMALGRGGVGRGFFRWIVEGNFGGVAQWHSAVQAQHQVDMRDPYKDRRLVEWCFGVPEDQFRRGGVGRWLVKRMMKGVLPDEVLFKPLNTGRVNADWHLRMTRCLPQMKSDLSKMAEDHDIARMIDIPRISAILDDWPSQVSVDPQHSHDRIYMSGSIPRALQVGRFIQLVKGSNV